MRAASISNCEAPVATMIFAEPRWAIAPRICSAPAAAAAFPICALSGIILMSIGRGPPVSGSSGRIMNALSGYVDLQVNGYADVDFNADELSAERVAAVCQRLW